MSQTAEAFLIKLFFPNVVLYQMKLSWTDL